MLLLFSLLLVLPTDSFKSFAKSGHEDYCLVNYQKKTVQCDYKTLNECREQYANHVSSLCFTRKSLKLKGDN
jgi:hypothetical protein